MHLWKMGGCELLETPWAPWLATCPSAPRLVADTARTLCCPAKAMAPWAWATFWTLMWPPGLWWICMLWTRGPVVPWEETATVMEEGGAEAIDLGKVEYCTVTGVCGSEMVSCLGCWSCWWMTVLGWAPCAGAGVMVVPSRYTMLGPWVSTLGKEPVDETTRPGPVTVTLPWGGEGSEGEDKRL